jgi:hypothetical protein
MHSWNHTKLPAPRHRADIVVFLPSTSRTWLHCEGIILYSQNRFDISTLHYRVAFGLSNEISVSNENLDKPLLTSSFTSSSRG